MRFRVLQRKLEYNILYIDHLASMIVILIQIVQLYCTEGGPVRSLFLLEHSDEGILSLNYEDTSKAICDDGFT